MKTNTLKRQKISDNDQQNGKFIVYQKNQNNYFSSFENYQKEHKRSINDPENFWREKSKIIDWIRPFENVFEGNFQSANIKWFTNGTLNACYNCVDRHLKDKSDQIAIIWEGDTEDQIRKITYLELYEEVCRFAHVLLSFGVKKGDSVCVYMPMIPEAAFVMLACSRIGAVHNVVFAGFSANALRERIIDCHCKIVVTANEGIRGGKTIPLKNIVDEALEEIDNNLVHHVLVWKRTPKQIKMVEGRDFYFDDEITKQKSVCPFEDMNSEDPLFMLYTSGSTGKPKGILHTTGGYLVYAALTHKYVFDYRQGDIYACVADIGWITGHTYVVYGPLLNGATTFMFESTPFYPNVSRYWSMIQRHKITQFYTAPTAIRAAKKLSDKYVKDFDLSSLRVLGSVGEPINMNAWNWYFSKIGNRKASIVDTYWQTETGGIIITPLPFITPLKPSSATFPFFGIDPVILDPKSGKEMEGNDVEGVLCIRNIWPGIARSIFNNHERYINAYMKPYPGYFFTGDGVRRDSDGYYFITGRVDDVLNVSGHRIGTAELESAIGKHKNVSESAVVGIPHEIKGQAIFTFVVEKTKSNALDLMFTEIKNLVRTEIGPFASVEHIVLCNSLPKTRSGKIMRRLLRKIATCETDNLGDISTLSDSNVVNDLIGVVNRYFKTEKN